MLPVYTVSVVSNSVSPWISGGSRGETNLDEGNRVRHDTRGSGGETYQALALVSIKEQVKTTKPIVIFQSLL